jgi:hypothetical protein
MNRLKEIWAWGDESPIHRLASFLVLPVAALVVTLVALSDMIEGDIP